MKLNSRVEFWLRSTLGFEIQISKWSQNSKNRISKSYTYYFESKYSIAFMHHDKQYTRPLRSIQEFKLEIWIYINWISNNSRKLYTHHKNMKINSVNSEFESLFIVIKYTGYTLWILNREVQVWYAYIQTIVNRKSNLF